MTPKCVSIGWALAFLSCLASLVNVQADSSTNLSNLTNTSTTTTSSTSTVTSTWSSTTSTQVIVSTFFDAELLLDSVQNFNESAYRASVAQAVNTSVESVRLNNIRYLVRFGYSLDADVTEQQMRAAIAELAYVEMMYVSVTIARRLMGRSLATTAVSAQIQTPNAALVPTIVANAESVRAVASALSNQNVAVSPTITTPPAQSVLVGTIIASELSATPTAPAVPYSLVLQSGMQLSSISNVGSGVAPQAGCTVDADCSSSEECMTGYCQVTTTTTLPMCPPTHPHSFDSSNACCSEAPTGLSSCSGSWVWCDGSNAPVSNWPMTCTDFMTTTSTTSATATTQSTTATTTSLTYTSASVTTTTITPCPLSHPFSFYNNEACCSVVLDEDGKCSAGKWQWCDATSGVAPALSLVCAGNSEASVTLCPSDSPYSFRDNKACCSQVPISENLCGDTWFWCDGSVPPIQPAHYAYLWCSDFYTTSTMSTTSTGTITTTLSITLTSKSITTTTTTLTGTSTTKSTTVTVQPCPWSYPWSFNNNLACCADKVGSDGICGPNWVWCDGTRDSESAFALQCTTNVDVNERSCPSAQPYSFLAHTACCPQIPASDTSCGIDGWVYCDGTCPPLQPTTQLWCGDFVTSTLTSRTVTNTSTTTTGSTSLTSTTTSSTTSSLPPCPSSHPFSFYDKRACCSQIVGDNDCNNNNPGCTCPSDSWVWCDGTSDMTPISSLHCADDLTVTTQMCPESHPYAIDGNRACCTVCVDTSANSCSCSTASFGGSCLCSSWIWCDGTQTPSLPSTYHSLRCFSHYSTTSTATSTTSSSSMTSTSSPPSTTSATNTTATQTVSTSPTSTTSTLPFCPLSHPFSFSDDKACCSEVLTDRTSSGCVKDRWVWCDGTTDRVEDLPCFDDLVLRHLMCSDNPGAVAILCPKDYPVAYDGNKACCSQQPASPTLCGAAWSWCGGTRSPMRPADYDTTWCTDFYTTTTSSTMTNTSTVTTKSTTSTVTRTNTTTSTMTVSSTTQSTSSTVRPCPATHPYVFNQGALHACCADELISSGCAAHRWVWCDGSSENEPVSELTCTDYPYWKLPVCRDDETWTDALFGSGLNSCATMISHSHWCTDYGDYSLEAQRACPVSCGICASLNYTLLGQGYCTPFQVHVAGYSLDDCARRCQTNSTCNGFAHLPTHRECILSDSRCAQRIINNYSWNGYVIKMPCTTKTDCQISETCEDGFCEVPCVSDSDCSYGIGLWCSTTNYCQTFTTTSSSTATFTSTTSLTTSVTTSTSSITATSSTERSPFARCMIDNDCSSGQLCLSTYCKADPASGATFVTTFELQLQLSNAQTFSSQESLKSVAAATGVSQESLEITSVSYQVSVQYGLSDSVSLAQTKTAIAAATGVKDENVIVSIEGQRRLISRQLGIQAIVITIETQEAESVTSISESSGNASKLEAAFSAQGISEVPTVLQEPSQSVKVSTTITSQEGAVEAPTAEAVSAAIGMDVEATIANVQHELQASTVTISVTKTSTSTKTATTITVSATSTDTDTSTISATSTDTVTSSITDTTVTNSISATSTDTVTNSMTDTSATNTISATNTETVTKTITDTTVTSTILATSTATVTYRSKEPHVAIMVAHASSSGTTTQTSMISSITGTSTNTVTSDISLTTSSVTTIHTMTSARATTMATTLTVVFETSAAKPTVTATETHVTTTRVTSETITSPFAVQETSTTSSITTEGTLHQSSLTIASTSSTASRVVVANALPKSSDPLTATTSTMSAAGSSTSSSTGEVIASATPVVSLASFTPATTTQKEFTSFATKLQMDDVETFDESKYVQSVALATGVDVNAVEVERIDYKVEVGYSFDAILTESEAVAAVAAVAGVAPEMVSVSIDSTRRLANTRRLGTTVSAIVKTEDAAAVANISHGLESAEAIQSALSHHGISATPTVSRKPKKSLEVVTKIEARNAVPVAPPTSDSLTQKLTVVFEGAIQVDVVDTLQEPEVVNAAPVQAFATAKTTAAPVGSRTLPLSAAAEWTAFQGSDLATAGGIALGALVLLLTACGAGWLIFRKRGKKELEGMTLLPEDNPRKCSWFGSQTSVPPELTSCTPTCIVCGEEASFSCAGCREVWYCKKAHQLEHWETHKVDCAASSLRSEPSSPCSSPAMSQRGPATPKRFQFPADGEVGCTARAMQFEPSSPCSPVSQRSPRTPSRAQLPAIEEVGCAARALQLEPSSPCSPVSQRAPGTPSRAQLPAIEEVWRVERPPSPVAVEVADIQACLANDADVSNNCEVDAQAGKSLEGVSNSNCRQSSSEPCSDSMLEGELLQAGVLQEEHANVLGLEETW